MSASTEDDEFLQSDNYYSWLGLHKNASQVEINNAFRRMSRMYHPDKHAGNADAEQHAEMLFTKIKKAHSVLTDPQQKAIYDTMGVKGLNTEGWQVVSRTKSPREILEEYECLQEEREKRRLEQSTNPRGNVLVGVDATDIFDRFDFSDALHYGIFPQVELNEMSISQSVDCPLTPKDTAVIAGNVSVDSSRIGSGNITTTYRRVISHKSWAEGDVSVGNKSLGLSAKGFRILWNKAFGTLTGTCHMTSKGFRPGCNAVVAQQLDKNFQVRMTYSLAPGFSALQTMVTWDNENNHVAVAIQLGVPLMYMVINYTHTVPDYDLKLRVNFKAGTMGLVGECGCEKKITEFSTLGAKMVIGTRKGVQLHIKLRRGNQNFNFPIHLSDDVKTEPIFYGTVVPLAVFVIVNTFVVKPFLRSQKEKDKVKKKEVNNKRKAEKQKEAKIAIELMKETIDRSFELETQKGGLVIVKSLYGNLAGESVDSEECINVTRALQALVKDSKLLLHEGTQLNELPGFYDPCVGEEKQITITYNFRTKQHICTYTESNKILLPNREHICDDQFDQKDDT